MAEKNQNMNNKVSHLLGYHVTNAARNMHRTLQQNFKKAGYSITAEQWIVLVWLFEKDGRTQQELSELTFKDKPGITRIMTNLETSKLIIRIGDPNDGRSKRVFLTKETKKMEDHLLEIAAQTVAQATKGIPEKDVAFCREVLNKIIDNLS
jgi:DNA-binding MarR family transcriptional regulator